MRRLKRDFNEVFIGSAALMLAILAWGLASMDSMAEFSQIAADWVGRHCGEFYTLIAVTCTLTMLICLIPRFRAVDLGQSQGPAEFSLASWFTMLFTAGMGIGLLYYGMAEPVLHSLNSPTGLDKASEAAIKQGFLISLLHLGIFPWSIYSMVGLGLLFLTQRYDLPQRISSLLYPILGNRINGPIGSLVDVLAIIAVLFGIATTLGVGIEQMSSGIHFLWDIPDTRLVQVTLIAIITLIATGSVVSGLGKGVKILSVATTILSLFLLVLVVSQNPLLDQAILQWDIHSSFIKEIIPLGLSLETKQNSEWQKNWTTFYWSWWIAWAPFVGMFIARISRGRTMREYVLGSVLVPAGFCSFWTISFGYAAHKLATKEEGRLYETIQNNFDNSFFEFITSLPLAEFTGPLTVLILVGFFVTSLDSGSLVVDIIASKGDLNPRLWKRVFWSLTEGALAATLLMAGGLKALQAGSLLSAIPFGIVMLALAVSLITTFIKITTREKRVNSVLERERAQVRL